MKPSKDHSGGSPHTDPKLLPTKDGSPTLYSSHFDATYHSLHGAVRESIHVFIKSGLFEFIARNRPQKIKIFEMGFGTGLNACLTASLCPPDISIEYHAVEKFPISPRLVEQLVDHLSQQDIEFAIDKELFRKMHQAPWGDCQTVKEGFSLCLYEDDILTMDIPDDLDLIYYDAFGPGTQPELWDDKITSNLYASSGENACFVTYSAQGAFRRSLIGSGFTVEKIPGPPGKREMLRAFKLK